MHSYKLLHKVNNITHPSANKAQEEKYWIFHFARLYNWFILFKHS